MSRVDLQRHHVPQPRRQEHRHAREPREHLRAGDVSAPRTHPDLRRLPPLHEPLRHVHIRAGGRRGRDGPPFARFRRRAPLRAHERTGADWRMGHHRPVSLSPPRGRGARPHARLRRDRPRHPGRRMAEAHLRRRPHRDFRPRHGRFRRRRRNTHIRRVQPDHDPAHGFLREPRRRQRGSRALRDQVPEGRRVPRGDHESRLHLQLRRNLQSRHGHNRLQQLRDEQDVLSGDDCSAQDPCERQYPDPPPKGARRVRRRRLPPDRHQRQRPHHGACRDHSRREDRPQLDGAPHKGRSGHARHRLDEFDSLGPRGGGGELHLPSVVFRHGDDGDARRFEQRHVHARGRDVAQGDVGPRAPGGRAHRDRGGRAAPLAGVVRVAVRRDVRRRGDLGLGLQHGRSRRRADPRDAADRHGRGQSRVLGDGGVPHERRAVGDARRRGRHALRHAPRRLPRRCGGRLPFLHERVQPAVARHGRRGAVHPVQDRNQRRKREREQLRPRVGRAAQEHPRGLRRPLFTLIGHGMPPGRDEAPHALRLPSRQHGRRFKYLLLERLGFESQRP